MARRRAGALSDRARLGDPSASTPIIEDATLDVAKLLLDGSQNRSNDQELPIRQWRAARVARS
jgi:hypothetical protein